jgi:hypothetical protein
LLTGAWTRAQCIQLAGSGCPVTLSAQCGGQPRIGQTFTVTCPSCQAQQLAFHVVGTCLAFPGWPEFFPPLTCTVGPCRLAVGVISTGSGGFRQFAVPRDNGLIGARVCIQGGCFQAGRPCFTLSGALELRIQAF